jgi:REP element-mobilizing transposase RayT
MAYDPEIHHRKSIRLRGYDYSAPGRYFVTICAQEKACLFGGIASGQIELNDYGRIVENVWKDLPLHFPLVELDRFVVMPNHFHAIVVIVDPRAKRVGAGFPRPDSERSETGVGAGFPRPDSERSETGVGAGFPRPMSPVLSRGGENPPLRALGDVIRWFKYESTKRINELRSMAGRRIWQRNYYEHIILSDKSYWRIREYIANNPKNWVKDKLHPDSNWKTNNWRGNIE